MIYKLKQGEHNFKPNRVRFHFGVTSGEWEVVFNETNLYQLIEWGDGWNKLTGWSYRLFPFYDSEIYGRKWCPGHHKHSIRIAWRPVVYARRIELCIYTYDNEVRRESNVVYVPINTPIRIKLATSKGYCRANIVYGLDAKPIYKGLETPYNVPAAFGYYLNPEFIDKGTPHDMYLTLRRIN